MLKKIALIVLFIGATVGMAFLLYRFFFAGPSAVPPVTEPGVTGPGGGLPTAGEGRPGVPVAEAPGGLPTAPGVPGIPGVPAPTAPTGVTVLAGETTFAANVAATSAGLNYYDASDGRFYAIDGDGNPVRLSDRSFPAVESAVWSRKGDKAVIVFPDQSKIVYDFEQETQVTLPRHWQDFAFSADGGTIVAESIGLDPANRWLVAAAADGSGTRLIEPLGENADLVTVSVAPSGSIVAFSDTGDPVGFDSRDLLPISPNGENLGALRVEGFGFTPQWSPGGNRLVYSAAAGVDDYLPALWVVRADGSSVGGSRMKLPVRTWADKCTFANDDVMYCAEPRGMPSGAGLQRDITVGLSDRLLRVDLTTGAISYLAQDVFEEPVSALQLSRDGSRLFVAGPDGRLKAVDLF